MLEKKFLLLAKTYRDWFLRRSLAKGMDCLKVGGRTREAQNQVVDGGFSHETACIEAPWRKPNPFSEDLKRRLAPHPP